MNATAHGKGALDGIGATFKRETWRQSFLRRSTEPILSPLQLFQWGKQSMKNMTLLFYSKQEHTKSQRFLNARFEKALPVPQISKNHCFMVKEGKILLSKRYSNASDGCNLVYQT